MKKLGVLISGGGTNLQALIDGCKIGEIKGEIAVVISSKPGVFGLERAAKHGIPAEFCSNQVDVLNILNKFQVELVVLAGYLKILDPELIRAFPERIINIHPSLI
ncbi:MAG: phosphoribosylglycinamide formyltransferase, partial [Tissierellia bacterium]|nr:phosphoribosylglycinamide formyltransferase [Tissierellia bacterium]